MSLQVGPPLRGEQGQCHKRMQCLTHPSRLRCCSTPPTQLLHTCGMVVGSYRPNAQHHSQQPHPGLSCCLLRPSSITTPCTWPPCPAACQACCQPFLSGHSQARSAPELARARITAALTGREHREPGSPQGLQQLEAGSRGLLRAWSTTICALCVMNGAQPVAACGAPAQAEATRHATACCSNQPICRSASPVLLLRLLRPRAHHCR